MSTPIFEKKNVLVTGGAGFIGSYLCERLLKEANVICIDDFSNSGPQNINHLLQYPDFEFINYDISKPIDLESFDELVKFKIKFQGIQEIYHLACPTSPKNFNDLKINTLLANSTAMINTLELAVKYKAKYVFSSSSVVYGTVQDGNSFKETDIGLVDHLSTRACYDEGKKFAESCVETYRQVYGVDAKIARVFTTYGARMRLFHGLLIPDFIVNAIDGKDLVIYGDEDISTSLCYISDLITGLTGMMAAEEKVKVVNLGGDKVIKFSEVAEMIIKMTGSNSKIIFEKPLDFLTKKGAADLSYASEALGWMPLVRLEDGLAKTVEYVIANRETMVVDR
jgi:UDP-glucuronate decarboxylase